MSSKRCASPSVTSPVIRIMTFSKPGSLIISKLAADSFDAAHKEITAKVTTLTVEKCQSNKMLPCFILSLDSTF